MASRRIDLSPIVTVGTESPAAQASQTTQAPKPKGAGDKLDAKQVKAALLAVGDMPTGWAAAEAEPDKEDTSTVEPAVATSPVPSSRSMMTSSVGSGPS